MKCLPAIVGIVCLSCQCAYADPSAFSNVSSMNKKESKEQETYKLLVRKFPVIKDIDDGVGDSFKSVMGAVGMDGYMSMSLKGAKGSVILYGGKLITASDFGLVPSNEKKFNVQMNVLSTYNKSEVDFKLRGIGLDDFQVQAVKDYPNRGRMGVFLQYKMSFK